MGNEKTIKERLATLETKIGVLCKDVKRIKENDLVHIQEKIDGLERGIAEIDKKLALAQMRLGIVIAIGIFVAGKLIDYLLK